MERDRKDDNFLDRLKDLKIDSTLEAQATTVKMFKLSLAITINNPYNVGSENFICRQDIPQLMIFVIFITCL